MEIRDAAQKMDGRGESEPIIHDDFSVKLVWGGDGMKAKLNVGGITRTIGIPGDSPEALCKAMDDAIAGLYDSFAERVLLSMTHGRSALRDAMEVYEKSMPEEYLDTKKDCRLRDFAGGILVTKAGATKKQVAKLTNRELRNFLETLVETNDPQFVKQAITMTVLDKEEAKPAQPHSGVVDINAIDD